VYPELKFKAFSLSDVEKALTLMEENVERGGRQKLERCRELGLTADAQGKEQELQIKR
jgi:hypothetical protein